MRRVLTSLCLLGILIGSAIFAQAQSPCLNGAPARARCASGQDQNGAYYLIVVPPNWNGSLVFYNQGGPPLTPPRPFPNITALGRSYLRQLLPQGFAMAATTYRAPGHGVTQAAADVENLRRIFIETFGRPRRTIVLGLSWGGLVSAKVAELFGVDSEGTVNYDGALPLCGVLAGTRRWADKFLDNRVVYQHFCQNLPRPGEGQYPLYLGLAPGSTMTRQQVDARLNECTGLFLPPEQRTEAQGRNLANILSVLRHPEEELSNQIFAATLHLQNLVQVRLGGRNPATNLGVYYTGSDDDEALNAGVERHGADPEAVAMVEADGGLTGDVSIPVLTLQSINDPNIFVENASAYQETFERAGTLNYLLQMYTNEGEHCEYTFSEFNAVFYALLDWIETGSKPTVDEIVASCEEYRRQFGDQCRFNPTYQPPPYGTRYYPREP